MDVFQPIHQLPPSAATGAASASAAASGSASSSASAPSISASGSASSATPYSSLSPAVLRLPPSFCSALSIRKSSFIPTLIAALLLTLAASRFVSLPVASRVPSSRAAHVDADALAEAGHLAEGPAERWGQGERGKTRAQEGQLVGANGKGAESPRPHAERAKSPGVERPGVYGEDSAGEWKHGSGALNESAGSLGAGSVEAEGMSEGKKEGGRGREEEMDNEGDLSAAGLGGQGDGREDDGDFGGALAADGRCLVCEQLARSPCIEDAPQVRWLPGSSNEGEGGEEGDVVGGFGEIEEAKRDWQWVWGDRDSSGIDSASSKSNSTHRSSIDRTTTTSSSSSSKGRQCVFHKMAGKEALRQLAGTWIVVAGDSEVRQLLVALLQLLLLPHNDPAAMAPVHRFVSLKHADFHHFIPSHRIRIDFFWAPFAPNITAAVAALPATSATAAAGGAAGGGSAAAISASGSVSATSVPAVADADEVAGSATQMGVDSSSSSSSSRSRKGRMGQEVRGQDYGPGERTQQYQQHSRQRLQEQQQGEQRKKTHQTQKQKQEQEQEEQSSQHHSQQKHVFVPTTPVSLSSPPSSAAPPPLPLTCPNIVILGSGLWHMLWVTDPPHFAAELAVLRSTVLRLLRSPRCSASPAITGDDVEEGDGGGAAAADDDDYGVGEGSVEAGGESVDQVAVAVVEGMRRAAAKEGSGGGGEVDKREVEEGEGEEEEEQEQEKEEGGREEGVGVKRRKGLERWGSQGGKLGEGRMSGNIRKGVGARRRVQEEGASGVAEDAGRGGEGAEGAEGAGGAEHEETRLGAEEARKHEVEELVDGPSEENGYGEERATGFDAEGDEDEEKQGGEARRSRDQGVVPGEASGRVVERQSERVVERQSEGEGLGVTGGDGKGEVEMVEMEEGVGVGEEEEQEEVIGGKVLGTGPTNEEERTVGGAELAVGELKGLRVDRPEGGEGEGEGVGERVGEVVDEREVKRQGKGLWNKEGEQEKEQGEEQEEQQAEEGKAVGKGKEPKERVGEIESADSEEDEEVKEEEKEEQDKEEKEEGEEGEEEKEKEEEEEGEEEEDAVVVRGAPVTQPLFFWLGLPELIQSRLNSERKREKMSPRMVNLYDAVVRRSGLLVERARGKVGGSVEGGEKGSEEGGEEGDEEGDEQGSEVEGEGEREGGGGSSGVRESGAGRGGDGRGGKVGGGNGRERGESHQVVELGPCVLLPLGELSKGCGEVCTLDGMHYNDDTYAAAVQIMLNHAARLL
ncbi:unnamed protein product [Closterium sp. NIES-53]